MFECLHFTGSNRTVDCLDLYTVIGTSYLYLYTQLYLETVLPYIQQSTHSPASICATATYVTLGPAVSLGRVQQHIVQFVLSAIQCSPAPLLC